MKFSSNEDVEAPQDAVFSMFTDFDGFERAILRQGAQISRTDSVRRKDVGMMWKASFKLRGKLREVTGELVEFTPVEGYAIDVASPNLLGFLNVELLPLSKSRTRVAVSLEIKPKSLSGRLMVQTLKLGKTRLTRRFKIRVAEFAKTLETKYKSGDIA